MELIAKRFVEIVDEEIYRDVVEKLAAEGEAVKTKHLCFGSSHLSESKVSYKDSTRLR